MVKYRSLIYKYLLLQVMMHACIAEEEGLFAIEDVVKGITGKIRGSLNEPGRYKKQEKIGKVDDKEYLMDAFDESQRLIETARKRKKKQKEILNGAF